MALGLVEANAMALFRRNFLRMTASAVALPALSSLASALDYPTHPVHVVAGFPAGTTVDIIARLVSEPLSQRLGQRFIVDDRPGAASNIATETVATASPDGYTLLLAVSTNAINATLYKNLRFDFVRDIVPIGMIGTATFVLVVPPSLPAKTLVEFIAYAKANPGKIYMATQGIGTPPHVAGELLKMMTGISFVHVPYKTALMPDLLAGRVQFYFSPTPLAVGYIRDGRLRALGVTSATRSAALPDVPAIAEFLPGYEVDGWLGIGAPKGTSTEIVERLNTEIIAIVADAKVKARLLDLGVVSKPMSSAEFEKFIAADVQKWAKVIRFAGIKAE
jgi:tripartite-type tricarboxylate transporter receptor subunit TctC